jgi:small-conductance mechanosensitive channel
VGVGAADAQWPRRRAAAPRAGGFAFKDLFQNFLAGLLILVTRPFRVGDQIRYKDYEGTVEDIQARATYINTYDGRRVIIPTGELYTNSVTVNTAFPQRGAEDAPGNGRGARHASP